MIPVCDKGAHTRDKQITVLAGVGKSRQAKQIAQRITAGIQTYTGYLWRGLVRCCAQMSLTTSTLSLKRCARKLYDFLETFFMRTI